MGHPRPHPAPPGLSAGPAPLPLRVELPPGIEPDAARELLAALPASHGLILFETDAGEVVQLAASADLRDFAHKRLLDRQGPRADLLELTRRVLACPCGSLIEADLLLLELARRRQPRTAAEIAERGQPWFLAIDPDAEHPVWRPTDLAAEEPTAERLLGPFPTRRAAVDFHQALDELFELCRFPKELRRAPGGTPCAYREMGRCPGACEGAEPIDAYRARAGQAVRLRAGDRARLADEARAAMIAATQSLDFERAARARDRLEQVERLGAPRLANATDARRLLGVLASPSERTGWIRLTLLAAGRAMPFADVRAKEPQVLTALLVAAAERLASAAPVPAPCTQIREQSAILVRWLTTRQRSPGLVLWHAEIAEDPAGSGEKILDRLAVRKR